MHTKRQPNSCDSSEKNRYRSWNGEARICRHALGADVVVVVDDDDDVDADDDARPEVGGESVKGTRSYVG